MYFVKFGGGILFVDVSLVWPHHERSPVQLTAPACFSRMARPPGCLSRNVVTSYTLPCMTIQHESAVLCVAISEPVNMVATLDAVAQVSKRREIVFSPVERYGLHIQPIKWVTSEHNVPCNLLLSE